MFGGCFKQGVNIMPTYEYKCLECNHTFELFQSMTAEHVKTCPECKGKVKRLIGAGAGPIFKGSGFYHTDYKNKPGKTSEPKSNTTPAKESKSPGTEKPGSTTTKKEP